MVSLISIILRHKKLVIIITAGAFVVSALVSLVIPPRFVSSASFLPLGVEQDITGLRDFFSSLGSIGEATADFLRARKNLVVDYIIRSRKMGALLSEQFDLAAIYGREGAEEIWESLNEHTSIAILEEGVMVLSVEDRDPRRAAEMVEAYLAGLDSILIGLTVDDAVRRSAFIAGEIERREQRLLEADSVIQRFQTEYRIYEIEEQAKAALKVASRLSARLKMLDVEKQLLEMSLRPASRELERVRIELELVEQQLLEIKEEGGVLFPSLDEFPDIASRYMRLLADRQVQEFVIAYVRLQLEEARIAVNRRESVIKIIDPPFIPEKRAWPKRKQIVIVSTLVALFWTCFVLLVREKWREGAFRFGAYDDEPGTRTAARGSGKRE
jgi:tyrosine-protein kinase Etk/Wzc